MRHPAWRWLEVALLGLLAAGPVSCGCTGDSITSATGGQLPPALVIGAIQPQAFIAYRPTLFSLFGSGFNRSAKPSAPATSKTDPTPDTAAAIVTVQVVFTAIDGTPFADGTSAEALVTGMVVSDSEIQGTSPVTNSPGGWACTVQVFDPLGNGVSGSPIAGFVGLTVFTIDPHEIRSDQATPFTVTGLAFLPVGGQATVRFTTIAKVFPGPADSLDVIADVIDAQTLTGTTPTFPLAGPEPTFVTVILHQEAGAPSTVLPFPLVVFEPPPPIPVVVNTITSPLPLDIATPFTVTGTGFLGGGVNPNVSVTFTTAPGTPFRRGTASSITVQGTATDDFTVVGTSPVGTSLTDVMAFVTVTRVDAVEGTSATPIALFTAPLATVTEFDPDVIQSDLPTAFTITGTNLPTGQTATVRFLAVVGTPFAGGTSATADVVANVVSATQIDGISPLATVTVPISCEVIVTLLSGAELPMGPECVFVPPPPPAVGCVVTNLNDAGPGSLRDLILNAPPDCVITFDPSLSGNLTVLSSLVVPHDVHVLGPGADVIRVGAGGGTFPVFTVSAGASATLELLTIRDSHNPGDGGGFFVRGDLVLIRCVVRDHGIGGRGGGVFVTSGGGFVLRDCTLEDNSADGRGGAVFVQTGALAQLSGCAILFNQGGSGGGGLGTDSSAHADAVNCTFHGNSTSGGPGGGGIFIAPDAQVSLTHCTVTENTTQNDGGGVLIQNGLLLAANCIFSRNAAGRRVPTVHPEISNKNGTHQISFSLVRVGTGSGLVNGLNGNQVGTENNPIDPDLKGLQQNGGPTQTQMPKQGSPVIDTGDPALCAPTDQRGVPRPIGPGCDRGAVEADVSLF